MGVKRRISRRFLLVVACLVAVPFLTQLDKEKTDLRGDFNCDLCLRDYHHSTIKLSCGYNYEIARRFAESVGVNPEIQISDDISVSLEALRADSLDIVVIPYIDSIYKSKEYRITKMMADSTLWVAHKDRKNFANSLSNWINVFEGTKENETLTELFSHYYEPYKRAGTGKSYPHASPYDDLIRKYADKLGWDWRVLTALIWQESRFRIDAKSSRGAEGLLQMMPSTAKRFSNDDMLDPEKNISAGVDYLMKLRTMFTPYCEEEDLPKFILGAYNAGEGKLLDCIRYAKGHNKPSTRWTDIENVIAEIRDSEEAQQDTLLHCGGLKTYETVNYITNIYSLYDAFSIISPGPSSQGQPVKQTETE